MRVFFSLQAYKGNAVYRRNCGLGDDTCHDCWGNPHCFRFRHIFRKRCCAPVDSFNLDSRLYQHDTHTINTGKAIITFLSYHRIFSPIPFFQVIVVTLAKGYFAKNRSCDAESIHVDEEPPKIYFDPNDPTIGRLSFDT